MDLAGFLALLATDGQRALAAAMATIDTLPRWPWPRRFAAITGRRSLPPP